MRRSEVRSDVTAVAGLGPSVLMAATLSLPDPAGLVEPPIVIFGVPGGGYSRGYFDMRFSGHAGYSEAEWHVARGVIHVAVDHVGVGESTIPDLAAIDFEILAATYDACVRDIVERLVAGSAAGGFPPIARPFVVGMGQSMGGGVTILTQRRFATFDAIAPCGISAIRTVLPQPDAASFATGKARFDAIAEGRASSHLELEHEGVDYRYAFHWDDVPADIVHADMQGGYPVRQTAPAFGSVTIPHCAVRMMLPGVFAEDAAQVTVPVLVANGERDTCPDPHAEAAAYPASRDVTIFIVPRMAHMHNFASTRETLWRRLHDWSRTLASA